KRDSYKVRLTCFSPSEFMLDCVFRGVPIEKVNVWNASTRFSRASYHKDATGDFTILEYGLDLTGGATAGTIKQFLVRFDDELKKYDRYLGSPASDDIVLARVSDDKLENIFKTQGINYSKKPNKDGFNMFDFELNGQSIRLYNFGGKDLMMDTHFKKISLEHVNIYNLSRKFVRVVNYKGKDVEYTALECNLDCEAGVTEGMIRHWIVSFGEDTRHFAEYTKKLQTAQK
ncbi:MAG: YbjN domain-containing protein, partial [Planctomycetes bacterium]|nr:YbjN domain-containing protein [Planctomycetota bacterium]